MMRNMFTAKPTATNTISGDNTSPPNDIPIIRESFAHTVAYLSSDSSEGDIDDDRSDDDRSDDDQTPGLISKNNRLPVVPPPKRRRLDIPYRTQRKLKRQERMLKWKDALIAVERLLKSKKTKFISGLQGLQARRTFAIQSHLRIVVKNQRYSIDASERAAESYGFAAKYGGRLLRSWTRRWTESRQLPMSKHGRHAKVYTLLSDPSIAAELRAYVRSNKWAMDPAKLAKFTKNELLPDAAAKYLQHITHDEMPKGLKKYLEIELFPRIHLKAGRGISLSTARRWLHLEGFRYTSHKKGLYFDGHDRPDVIAYRQNDFLPAMKEIEPRLVRYVVGNVHEELVAQGPTPWLHQNFVQRRVVLCPQDEMTSQANDAPEKSWVLGDHHPLRKKGVGHGIHQSDIICSSIGWLKEGSQSLEYGKNYDGYWNGELFVKQVLFMILYLCKHFNDSLPPSFRRKLFRHLNEHMVQGIKLS
jgi:hypothetical protein